MTLSERIREARQRNLDYPGYGGCYRCQRRWPICQSHATPFRNQDGEKHGCFPLCQECWEELTPEQRLVYYQQLWAEWESWDKMPREEWHRIEEAVKQGL